MAQSQQYDQDGVIDIFRQYGDHLYNKGDHDGAITQYIKTIGKLEASYVIRKVSLLFYKVDSIYRHFDIQSKDVLKINSKIKDILLK